MPEKLYVITMHDLVHRQITSVLRVMDVNVNIRVADEFGKQAEDLSRFDEVIAIFVRDANPSSQDAHIPNEFLRRLESFEKARERRERLFIPSQLERFLSASPTTVVALRPERMPLKGEYPHARLIDAMRNLHFRDRQGKWTGPVSSRRAERKTEQLEKRMERIRSGDYGSC